jgi:hypothetical protein
MSINAPYKRHVAELPFGEYQAHLISIDEIESKAVPSEPGEIIDPLCWKWSFRISQDPYDGVEITGVSSRTFSQKSKSYLWAMSLGHPGGGADFSDSHILGHACRLQISVDEKADGASWNRVMAVLCPVKAQHELDLTPRPIGALS